MPLLKTFHIFVLAYAVGQAVAMNSIRPEFAPSSFGATGSTKIDALLLTSLQRKQEQICEFPGGPICDAIHCCRPGESCCPTGCCPEPRQCVGEDKCCPAENICPGGMNCCRTVASCCGSGCCPEGEICERSECIDKNLANSVARFNLDKAKNKELLKNMCEGMRRRNGGKTTNTDVLTYRGKEKGGEARGPIRRQAGCVRGFCSKPENNGGDPANNSCDEYPPASSLEGGNSLPLGLRIIVCLPQSQNSHQGQRFTDMLKQYKAANGGQELKRNGNFVISIDCEEVAQARRELPQIVARDAVSSSGFGAVDPDMSLTNNSSDFVLLALGDLASGTYTINVQVTAGATSGGYVFDNEGDEIFASSTSGLTTGQSQQYSFTLDDDRFGLGLALITNGNGTTATFNLTGTTTNPSTSTASTVTVPIPTQSNTSQPLPTVGTNPIASGSSGQTIFTLLGVACAVILCILNSA